MSIHQQASVRYTFNMPIEMHRYLKYAALDDGVRMNALVKNAIEFWIKTREEEIDEKHYLEGKKDADAGNVMDFDDAMKEIGL